MTSDKEENKSKGFNHFSFFCDEVALYRTMFTTEQIGELFCAIMHYVATGERLEVSGAIAFPYAQKLLEVDRARTAYADKVEKNRVNGAKGGKAKASKGKKGKRAADEDEPDVAVSGDDERNEIDDPENNSIGMDAEFEAVEKMLSTCKWQPPTYEELCGLVHTLCGTGQDAYDYPGDREVCYFYDAMNGNGWKSYGQKIGNELDLRTALIWSYVLRLPIINRDKDEALFRNVMATDQGGFSWSGAATDWLLQHYDSHQRAFEIDGRIYKFDDVSDAVDALLKAHVELEY